MNYQTVLLLLISTFVTTGIYNLSQETVQTTLQAPEAHQSFENWKATHQLSFNNPQEHSYRLSVFQENIKYIQETNAKQSNFELGVNKFATLTQEEFKQLYLSETKPVPEPKQNDSITKSNDLPTEFNWQEKGVITPVVDEGKCDASYVYSSLGALQAMHVRMTGANLEEFSAQDVLSCNTFGGGCQGGSVKKTLQYLMDTNKVYTEASYPYTSGNGQIAACKTQGRQEVQNFNFFSFMTSSPVEEHEQELKTALQINPVSSGIDGHNLQFYKSGVYDNCGQDRNIDMLIVGYTADYWQVKTPFGTNWGEQGYLKLKMGNTCGVAVEFFTPLG